MDYPNAYRYTRTHEWVRVEGDEVVVGITDHAQDQLGDVVYVELPAEGARFQKGEPFGVIESVKGGLRSLRAGGRRGDGPQRGGGGGAGAGE